MKSAGKFLRAFLILSNRKNRHSFCKQKLSPLYPYSLYVPSMNRNAFYCKKISETLCQVFVTDIYDEFLLERIRLERQCRIEPIESSENEIRKMKRRDIQSSSSIINEICTQQKKVETANSWESEPIINLVDSLLDEALKQRATDIHLEPSSEGFRIRFRKDGLLSNYRNLPQWIADPTLIRLKLLANVDITERRLPLDGSFLFQGNLEKVNIRLSTIPIQEESQNSEKCVLRLLPSHDEGRTLDDLQISEKNLKALRHSFDSPQGILLITGPTGSGKTTTLYAGLREIIPRKINVTTIEDPVEYRLIGANQVQVNSKCGLTFAQALRSILRQDPDVILIGEIRDSETAQIAMQAAQTGHLVLATLHTNNAMGAYSRLEDFGISAKQLNDCLLGIVAQRLLRKTVYTDKGNYIYNGRIAAMEFLHPNGNFADGSIEEYAKRLVTQGKTSEEECRRVLGQLTC